MPDRKPVLVVAWAYHQDMLHGVQQFLLSRPDLRLCVCMAYWDPPGEVRRLRRLRRQIDHIRPSGILAPATRKDEAVLKRSGVSVVNVGDHFQTSLPTVIFDQRSAGGMAAEHFLEQGLKHFAFASGTMFYYATLRWQGFRDRLRKAGFEACFFHGPQRDTGDRPVPEGILRRWIARLPKPVGLHLGDTPLAMEVLWACQQLELRVPEDVAVLGGMDREFVTTTWEPALSAFAAARWRLGFEGMKLLDRLMKGHKPPSQPILLPFGPIIQRQSTNVLMMRDREVAEALRFIRENAHRPILVDDVLQAVPLSRRALERRFTKVMHRTLHDDILQVHIERAKTLLGESHLSIAQVAEQSGFTNYHAFSGAFRKETGMTPKQCRAQSALI